MSCVNNIDLIGTVSMPPEYSHTVYGEAFFRLLVSVRRLSGAEDLVPVTASERLLSIPADGGDRLRIGGEIRSYNKRTEAGSRLVVTVFARELEPAEDGGDMNEAELTGFICKPPVYRTTPFSREIADVLLAVNRRTGRSDYLPVIAWGRNARFVSELPVGTELTVLGRLQSREYKKRFEDGTEVVRTAYEVSAGAVSVSEANRPSQGARGAIAAEPRRTNP